MGTTLTGTTPQDTYDSLIKVTDNGPLSGTAKYLSDGLGNDSALAVSTAAVGIGTNNPTWKLQVQTTDVTAAMFRSSGASTVVGIDNSAADGDPQLKFYINDIGTFTLGVDDSDSDKFKIGTSDLTTNTRLTIDSAGNVGIGTSAPIMPFEVVKSSTATLVGNIYYSSRFLQDSVAARGILLGYDSTSQVAVIGAETNGPASSVAFYTYSAPVWAERFRVTANGVTFNGDTAAANALDDYEEGTWTMGVSFGGASVGVTYSNTTGTYTKIGRQVTVNGVVVLTSKGSSTGSVLVTGLPFIIGNNISYYPSVSVRLENVTFANQFQAYGGIGSAVISLNEITEAGVNGELTNTDFANNSTVMLSATYFV